MGNFVFLDVAIGIVFFFLALSIIVTWVQELLATVFAWRSNHLVNFIQAMLDPTTEKIDGVKQLEKLRKEGIQGKLWEDDLLGDGVGKLKENAILAFYEHPIINSLSKPKGWGFRWLPQGMRNLRFPSYIAAEDFSTALLDILQNADEEIDQTKDDFERIKSGLENYLKSSGQENHSLKVILQRVDKTVDATFEKYEDIEDAAEDAVEKIPVEVKKAQKKIEDTQKEIEAWFNNFMDRASGWYKRYARTWAVILGLIVAVAFNADSVRLTTELWENQALRTQLVARATDLVQKEEAGEGTEFTAQQAEEILSNLGLPIGWELENLPDPDSKSLVRDWIVKALGWFITGLAISQGSSFWFDFLNRIVKLRDTGAKPKVKEDEQG
ncbi:hypothetical protein ACFLXI_05230 [Chloroflexota bacterium]